MSASPRDFDHVAARQPARRQPRPQGAARHLLLTARLRRRLRPVHGRAGHPARAAPAPIVAPVPYAALSSSLSAASDAALLRQALLAARRGDVTTAQGLQAQMTNATAKRLVTWAMVDSDGPELDYFTLVNAMRDLEGWPRPAPAGGAGEGAGDRGHPAAQVISIFQGRDPETAQGAHRAGLSAYQAQGRTADASALVKHFWRNHAFDAELQGQMLARFGIYLTQDDHAARLEMLLYSGDSSAARQLMEMVTPDQRALAQARHGLPFGAVGRAPMMLGMVPASLQSDPGPGLRPGALLPQAQPGIDRRRPGAELPHHHARTARGHQGHLGGAAGADVLGAAEPGLPRRLCGGGRQRPAARPGRQRGAVLRRLDRTHQAEQRRPGRQAFRQAAVRRHHAHHHEPRLLLAGPHRLHQGRRHGRQPVLGRGRQVLHRLLRPALRRQDRPGPLRARDRSGSHRRRPHPLRGPQRDPGGADAGRRRRPPAAGQLRHGGGGGHHQPGRTGLLVDLCRMYADQSLSMRVVRSAAMRGLYLPQRGYPLRTAPVGYGLAEPAFVFAITRQESSFDPTARSSRRRARHDAADARHRRRRGPAAGGGVLAGRCWTPTTT